MPVLRALVFHHDRDPVAWTIDDECFFGDDFLVVPILSPSGERDVHLPDGEWVDLWDGVVTRVPVWRRHMTMGLPPIPVFVRAGAAVPVYRSPVPSTSEMDLSVAEDVLFDASYTGFGNSILGEATDEVLR